MGSSAAATGAAVAAPYTPVAFFAVSNVPPGDPGPAARTFPDFSITKTPRVVLEGAFFRPIAEMRVELGSQRRGYGSFCFSLKVVLAFGESLERP
jgi:hypothetical protein